VEDFFMRAIKLALVMAAILVGACQSNGLAIDEANGLQYVSRG
jgi:hypothetical protein